MANGIVLSSAMRSNLLSLQNTQSLIDKTQLKLATGLKVASALDNPQNFFSAQSLNNRASDLKGLLDGIGQSIRTIQEADKGITALTSLVEQAKSVVTSARDELAASTGEARITGNVDLSSTATLIGLGTIANGDQFSIFTTDDSGTQITQEITINTGDTIYSLAANITNAFADNENGEIKASVTSEGTISIESTGGRSFQIRDDVNAANYVTLAGFTAIGLGDYFEDATHVGVTAAQSTVVGGNTISTISLYESAGDTVEAGDLLTGTYLDSDGNTVFDGFANGDSFTINLDLGSGVTATSGAFTIAANSTFQDLVDHINQTAAVNEYIEASFDSATGKLSITSLQDTVQNLELTYTAAGATDFSVGFGDPTGNLDPQVTVGAGTHDTVYRFNNSTQALDSLADDYNNIRSQIDDIVKDAQYRGVNLLNGDDLTTFFNEDNSSKLTTEGATFTSTGLGLNAATFRSSEAIESTSTESTAALNTVRSFGSTLANNLSIIQIRQTFTNDTINTLKSGADDLTVADSNEEGANLLALQTRQSLGVTSLSLASQSQQSVLRLF